MELTSKICVIYLELAEFKPDQTDFFYYKSSLYDYFFVDKPVSEEGTKLSLHRSFNRRVFY